MVLDTVVKIILISSFLFILVKYRLILAFCICHSVYSTFSFPFYYILYHLLGVCQVF